jgi:RND family efflux transporter MFP subunit
MQADYDRRLYRYEHMDEPAGEDEIAWAQADLTTAQLQLAQAQRELEDAQAGAAPGDLAMAEVQLAEAQATWERCKDGPDLLAIALAEEELAAAQAKLAIAQEEQLVVDLVAPEDGIVLSVNVEAGDRLRGGTVLTLADRSQSLVEVYVDESESSFVQIGNRAEIIFDASPDLSFTGEIVDVAPSLAETNGEEQLLATVLLDETSSDLALKLPVGLNGTVDLIAGEAQNAVLVPMEALHEASSGEYVVYVSQDEEWQQRPVSVGLMNYTTAEILEGLSAGETVALGELEGLENTEVSAGVP